jgi:flagellar hook-basal body complex protein FliE
MIPVINSVSNPLVREAGFSDPLQSMQHLSRVGGQEPFGDLLKDAISNVNQLENKAHEAVTGLMKGTGVDVHQAMIASEKASMAFEMVLAVRNKAVQSYQNVMSMQF